MGAIDGKFDVAVSTACGPLDNIVVDTVKTAEACVAALKRHNVGRATFIALEKQEHLRDTYTRHFQSLVIQFKIYIHYFMLKITQS